MTETGRRILRRVVDRIAEIAPPGLGHWNDGWDLTHPPADAFLDALAEWEADDRPATRDRLKRAAEDFVRSWREAARRWEEAGRPEPKRELQEVGG